MREAEAVWLNRWCGDDVTGLLCLARSRSSLSALKITQVSATHAI